LKKTDIVESLLDKEDEEQPTRRRLSSDLNNIDDNLISNIER